MRLTEQQIADIKQVAHEVVDSMIESRWSLWLFGSRLNDEAKGGDVDFCLISPNSPQELFQVKLALRPALEELLDIPVDLVVQPETQPYKLVVQQALESGIRLV
ncbi:MAG: nucleotidyltransferase domain-containing protein [Gammaproteobacteria bacterium]|nr:nucleotidyltransferase domain-containing protein [Gammaproteobacteria bacterium]